MYTIDHNIFKQIFFLMDICINHTSRLDDSTTRFNTPEYDHITNNGLLYYNIGVISVIILLSIGFIFFIYQMKQNKKRWEEERQRRLLLIEMQENENRSLINQNYEKIEELKKRLDRNITNETELLQQIEKLHEKNNDIQNIFTPKEIFDKELVNSAVYHRFRNPGIKTITDDEIEEFVDLINKAYPNLKSSLLQLCPSLTSEDLLICYFSKAEIPPTAAAIIMQKSESNISNKRARLSKRIFGQDKNAKIFDEKINQIY